MKFRPVRIAMRFKKIYLFIISEICLWNRSMRIRLENVIFLLKNEYNMLITIPN